MIEEVYVSFETAKLLKEKGFPVKEISLWYCEYDGKPTKDIIDKREYPCISQSLATKWLRDEYGIFIELLIPSHDEHEDTIYHDSFGFDIFNTKTKGYMYCGIDVEYDTYEEAVESAIQYCLTELI